MRQHIHNLKKKLQWGEVTSYNWVPTEDQLADILTKDKKYLLSLDQVMQKSRFDSVLSRDNCVRYIAGEMDISGRKLRDAVGPKANTPMRQSKKGV